jgi:hypothetical protein
MKNISDKNNSFNPLFMIISCKKEKKMWKNIQKKFEDYNYVILCGDNKGSNYSIEKNIIYIDCNDLYDGLPEKVLGGLLVINNDSKFKNISHIIKIDSNNYLSRKNIKKVLSKVQKLSEYDYFGQKVHEIKKKLKLEGAYHFKNVIPSSKWYKQEYKGDYCDYLDGGYSYCLSRKSINLITSQFNFSNFKSISDKHIYEDLMIALLLRKFGIFPVEQDLFITSDKETTTYKTKRILRKLKNKTKNALRKLKNKTKNALRKIKKKLNI